MGVQIVDKSVEGSQRRSLLVHEAKEVTVELVLALLQRDRQMRADKPCDVVSAFLFKQGYVNSPAIYSEIKLCTLHLCVYKIQIGHAVLLQWRSQRRQISQHLRI